MTKILKEEGKIWLVETSFDYGTFNTKKTLVGTYEEKPIEPTNEDEKPKKVYKQKKSEE